MDMYDNLQNVDVSSWISLLNSYTLPQYNESSNLNEMNIGVENGDVNSGHCYMNSLTGSESRNQNSIYYRKKIDEISPKRSEVENNVLQDGVVIYVILPVPTLNQYADME